MAQLKLSDDILTAALEGYEARKARIDAHIAEIRGLLGETGAGPSGGAKPKRKVSASARRRMARAQRLRWKRIKQSAEAPPAVTARPKRQLSAAARKRIAVAQKKRWAAIKGAAKPQPGKANRKKAAAAPEQSASAGA